MLSIKQARYGKRGVASGVAPCGHMNAASKPMMDDRIPDTIGVATHQT
jgi:hypothetical protein